ncbi:hypothetical protein DMA15_07640 [Streptomyces sp. WAC 01529]|uniref:hypothetical protein n=1 Tax=Streptomyces sp. WAC 01529 TaxID=2203205 RepID=UPI000F6D4B3E|nr:hypothetical protein [Streptomyces sp. WAC 01529]AZM52487.1 hypothetical protein DMA15_07640 [Streptomyces sp. WAC 01529]
MSVRTHPRRDPAESGGVEIQLPWWAIALPALAFAALLLLILNPADAHAASGAPAATGLLEHIQALISRMTP